MVFKLGIRLLNMETPTLSPSAPETRRGFFFLITSGYGCRGGRDQRGSCWRRNSRHEARGKDHSTEARPRGPTYRRLWRHAVDSTTLFDAHRYGLRCRHVAAFRVVP